LFHTIPSALHLADLGSDTAISYCSQIYSPFITFILFHHSRFYTHTCISISTGGVGVLAATTYHRAVPLRCLNGENVFVTTIFVVRHRLHFTISICGCAYLPPAFLPVVLFRFSVHSRYLFWNSRTVHRLDSAVYRSIVCCYRCYCLPFAFLPLLPVLPFSTFSIRPHLPVFVVPHLSFPTPFHFRCRANTTVTVIHHTVLTTVVILHDVSFISPLRFCCFVLITCGYSYHLHSTVRSTDSMLDDTTAYTTMTWRIRRPHFVPIRFYIDHTILPCIHHYLHFDVQLFYVRCYHLPTVVLAFYHFGRLHSVQFVPTTTIVSTCSPYIPLIPTVTFDVCCCSRRYRFTFDRSYNTIHDTDDTDSPPLPHTLHTLLTIRCIVLPAFYFALHLPLPLPVLPHFTVHFSTLFYRFYF